MRVRSDTFEPPGHADGRRDAASAHRVHARARNAGARLRRGGPGDPSRDRRRVADGQEAFDEAAVSHVARRRDLRERVRRPSTVDRAARSSAQAGAAAESRRGRERRTEIDGGWPRDYATPSWRDDPGVSAASGELGRTASHGGVRRRFVQRQRRRQARARDRQDRGRHVGGRQRAARQLQQRQADGIALPRPAERSAPGSRRHHHRGRPAGRADDRARPRARAPRQESDHPEERRRREGRSAGHLLQHVAGDPRQPRWRSDLEPDQGQRPQVRRQHELGSVRARPDQDVLPPLQPELAERRRRQGTVEAGGQAAGQLREAARRRQLEGREGGAARPHADVARPRCSSARRPRS